jgi:predicted alpha/beta hydrolase
VTRTRAAAAKVKLRRERLTTTAADGTQLALDRIAAEGEPRAVCLAGHAMMSNGRSLDRRAHGIGSTLARAGIETYALSFRGHGRSAAPPGGWEFEDLVAGDIPAALATVAERHPDVPLVGVGHSLAGVAMLAYLGRRAAGGFGPHPPPGLDALVTISTNVWLPHLEPNVFRRAGKRFVATGLATIAAVVGEFPARRLRMGSDPVSRGLARDVRRWSRSGRWTSPAGDDQHAMLERVRTPVLAVFAGGDRFYCNPAAGAAFHAPLPAETLETLLVDSAMAGYDPGHADVIMDSRCLPAWQEIGGWALRQAESAGRPDRPGRCG